MRRNAFPLLALVPACGFALAPQAYAVLIAVNFSVLGDPLDPVNAGQTANGYFSFDSSLIPSGGGIVGSLGSSTDLSSSISFGWDGTTWTSSDAGVNFLVFNSSGQLTNWLLAGDPSGLSGIAAPIGADDIALGPNGGLYARSVNTSFLYWCTTTSWSVDYGTGSAPEPATWLLMGGGLLGLMPAVRRRSTAQDLIDRPPSWAVVLADRTRTVRRQLKWDKVGLKLGESLAV